MDGSRHSSRVILSAQNPKFDLTIQEPTDRNIVGEYDKFIPLYVY